ncbi:MAG: class I SAM-dependent methyltransferase [Lachnospiraceae bacterium]|nr:class I SAM-dependent methyltransferase [Lachnospiraceae bacterium]
MKPAGFNEILRDRQLNIDTTGRDETHSDEHHSPYEPTPYCVLDRMIDRGIFDDVSYLIDFGCGKGRVSLYLACRCGLNTTGIEKEPVFYKAALKNLSACVKKGPVRFENGLAENHAIPEEADAFFFFRPFSGAILKRVLKNILVSYYDRPRRMKLIFYYVTPEYISCLDDHPEFQLIHDIDCRDLFNSKDAKDRIMLYQTAPKISG